MLTELVEERHVCNRYFHTVKFLLVLLFQCIVLMTFFAGFLGLFGGRVIWIIWFSMSELSSSSGRYTVCISSFASQCSGNDCHWGRRPAQVSLFFLWWKFLILDTHLIYVCNLTYHTVLFQVDFGGSNLRSFCIGDMPRFFFLDFLSVECSKCLYVIILYCGLHIIV